MNTKTLPLEAIEDSIGIVLSDLKPKERARLGTALLEYDDPAQWFEPVGGQGLVNGATELLGLLEQDTTLLPRFLKERFRMVPSVLERTSTEVAVDQVGERLNEIQEQFIKRVEKAEADLEAANRELRRAKRLNPRSNAIRLYVLLLILAGTFTAFLIYRGLAQHPEVTIQFNVGEIIGAVLAGGGIAAAGVAYAADKLRERE